MKIHFLGHSCFLLEGSKKIIIDPYLKPNNPVALTTAEEIECDYILVTHGHRDHLGDAIKISKRTGATIIAVWEIVYHCQTLGATGHGMHIGGINQFDGIKIKLTQALHGSGHITEEGKPVTYLGNPCGFLVWMDGICLYHAGDTGLFGDMRTVIGDLNKIDVACLCIPGNYMMDPDDAVIAADWLKAKYVIPMHYNSTPHTEQDPQSFKAKLEDKTNSEGIILNPGESFEI